MNVSDWIVCQVLHEYFKVGVNQATPQETWLAHCAASASAESFASGKTRPPFKLTPALDAQILTDIKKVKRGGKKPDTYAAYTRNSQHMEEVQRAKNWPADLTRVEPAARDHMLQYWMSKERVCHGNKASTGWNKLSAVRWTYVVENKPDPIENLPGLKDYMSNWEKMDGPVRPKLPSPLSMLMAIFTCLELWNFDHLVIHGSLSLPFWLLLRSIEYLADDSGKFDPDRSITWQDLRFRDAAGRTLSHVEVALNPGLVFKITATLYSSKNSKETCTRTISRVLNRIACPVATISQILAAIFKRDKKLPDRKASLFVKSDGTVMRRKDVSKILKTAAMAAKLPKARFASHSLRRGGATHYVAAGKLSDEEVCRLGRWTSTAYRAYVYSHSEESMAAMRRSAHLTPILEKG